MKIVECAKPYTKVKLNTGKYSVNIDISITLRKQNPYFHSLILSKNSIGV